VCSRAPPAKNRVDGDEVEIAASATPPSSGKSRRRSNSDGLLLTKGGRVSMSSNEVNAKYDSSYRNSDNTNTLLGKRLTLGQACGIIGVALYGADIPLEDSGV
jgi:hypothetical protein